MNKYWQTILQDEIHTWTSLDETDKRMWQISRIQRDIESGVLKPEGLVSYITEKMAQDTFKHAGVERPRVQEIVGTARMHEPLIAVLFDDGCHRIIDGNHRFVALFLCKVDTFRYFSIPEAALVPYDLLATINQ